VHEITSLTYVSSTTASVGLS